jgi:hypothetical protein
MQITVRRRREICVEPKSSMRFFVLLFAALNLFGNDVWIKEVSIASGYGDLDVLDSGNRFRYRWAGKSGWVLWAWIDGAHFYLKVKDEGSVTLCGGCRNDTVGAPES